MSEHHGVIGVHRRILMVAITMILAAVIAFFVFGMAGSTYQDDTATNTSNLSELDGCLLDCTRFMNPMDCNNGCYLQDNNRLLSELLNRTEAAP